MQTHLASLYENTPEGKAAQAILSKCVHCGFCTATCPTYQLLGDELDGPRGRIYLIKQVLEGQIPTRQTQLHLDRCLTCRNCETTCPSGVDYGHLVDIGRGLVDAQIKRSLFARAVRAALIHGLPSVAFRWGLALAKTMRPLLPAAWRAKIPQGQVARALPVGTHIDRVILAVGCVQPAMLPNIDVATRRVLDAAGIETWVLRAAKCCGALRFHLNDQARARDVMRTNIDAWWPAIEAGARHIVTNASGCGVFIKDYGYLLQDDPVYAAKAKRVSELTVDVGELLPQMLPKLLVRLGARAKAGRLPKIAYHPPCTLQHGQRLVGQVETHLQALGFQVALARVEAQMCCGSAGTYSLLEPKLSRALRDRKLGALPPDADVIASSNVGCIAHLQTGCHKPVRHWIEIVDDALSSE